MSHIVRTLLVVQISIVTCLCIGLSPLSAGAEDSIQQGDQNTTVFEIVAQTVKEEPVAVAKVQGQPKIAVFRIVNEAEMDPKDVSTLDTIVKRTVTEVAHGRYGIVVVEPPKEGEYCDDSCMLERAGTNGATYAILGKLSSFAGGQVLSLELRKTDGAEVVASTVTDAVALEKLPGETRAAAELLITRSPFEKPATKGVTSGGVIAARAQMLNRSSRRLKPPGYAGPRIAAHVLFWLGLDFGGGAAILLEAGLEREGAIFIVIGSTLVILAAICAGSYSKKKRERKEWDRRYGGQMYGGPIITPDFAGMGLVKSF